MSWCGNCRDRAWCQRQLVHRLSMGSARRSVRQRFCPLPLHRVKGNKECDSRKNVEPIDRARAERAARVYKSNQEAATALVITRGGFGRLCKRLEIETPAARGKRVRGGS
jgi:hypothetical protein